MIIFNRRLHIHPWLTIVTVIAFGFLVSLGNWQMKRLEWKQGLIKRAEEIQSLSPRPFDQVAARAAAGEDMEYTPVFLDGAFDTDKPAMVFGSYESTAGIFLFAPLSAASGEVVYINRGFVSQAAASKGLPTPPGGAALRVTGLFRTAEKPSPPASWFLPSANPEDGLWLVRDPMRFASAAAIAASPYYIDSFAVEGAEWPKGGTTRLEFNNRHREYALTWYAAALTLIGVWFAFSLQKP